MRRSILAMIMSMMGALLPASEALDKECLRYNDAAAKLQKADEDALAKEKAKTIAVLAAIAKQRTRNNDMAGADEAWKAVLGLDESQADARKYFELTGKLEAVLAEVKQAGSVDLLGAPTGDAGDAPSHAAAIGGTVMTIAAMATRKSSLGALKAGTEIVIQYVSGTWGRVTPNGDTTMRNPDAAVTPARFRLRLSTDPANPDATLAVVPIGTAQSPYSFKLDNDCENLYLCMNQDGNPDKREGEVHYRVKVTAP